MAFDTQITDLVGGTIDQVACDQWAADACKEIIHQLPAELKAKCMTATGVGTDSVVDLDGLGEILYVTRKNADSGYYTECREIPSSHGGLATDSTDLNYYGTASDPVYWVDGDTSGAATLYVKPTPTANQPAILHHIGYPTVNVSDVSVIANFPDEAEYLVVLYTAIKQLQQYMNSKRSDLPSDLTLPVLESISESLPTWSAPDDFVAPTVPVSLASPSFSTPTIGAITVASTTLTNAGTAPLYTKPSLTTRVAFNDYWTLSDFGDSDPGVLGLVSIAPATPSLSTTSVSFSTTAPTFTSPVVSPDFSQVNTYIDTDEDVELASAKLQEISAQLNEYSANIQKEQIKFNEESVEYQAQLQISIQNAQFDNQEDARKLQKYQAEVSTYQANVNKEVQEYGQKLSRYNTELNTVYTAWAKTESDSLQQYSADIQNNLNDFNRANSEYQVKLQEAIQQAQLTAQKAQQQAQLDSADAQQEASLKLQKENQEYSSKLQKYQAELGKYATELNENSQTFTNAVAKNRAAFDTSMQKYTSEVQKVSASNASTLQKFQAETADYSAKLQKQGIDYTWYQGQYAQLKADYAAGLAALKGTQQ